MPPRRNPINFDQFEETDSGFVESSPAEDSSEDEVVEFAVQEFVEVPLIDQGEGVDQEGHADQDEAAEGQDQQVDGVLEAPPELPLQLAETDTGKLTHLNFFI